MFFKVFSAQGIVQNCTIIPYAGLSFDVSCNIIFKNPFNEEVELTFLYYCVNHLPLNYVPFILSEKKEIFFSIVIFSIQILCKPVIMLIY